MRPRVFAYGQKQRFAGKESRLALGLVV
jgi:hypothetical protein